MPSLDPELSFLQHETYIDYLISTSQFPLAYQCISSLAQSLKEDNADVQQRISVLLMQAELWRRVGRPERGFSVALTCKLAVGCGGMSRCNIEYVGRVSRSEEIDRGCVAAGMLISHFQTPCSYLH